MKKTATIIAASFVIIFLAVLIVSGCGSDGTAYGSAQDTQNTQVAANTLQGNQPTPTDIKYSLERYNLIRRAYWVNGQREKADMLLCEVEKPLGYILLMTESGSVVGSYIVDGKVSSLNSFLTPDSEYYEIVYGGEFTKENHWLADVDGSYGNNDNGIFFFTPDGHYHEWNSVYHYSDVPFEIEVPVLTVVGEQQ